MTSTATIVYVTSRDQTPGPGAYMPPSDFGKAPSWTIKHKYPSKHKCNQAGYDALPSSIGTGPKYSLSSRHKERDYVGTPGPSYIPPKLGQDAHASSLHMRPPDKAAIPLGPGPGKYMTTKGLEGNRYSMKARQWPDDQGGPDGPGAGKYLPDYDKTMRTARKSAIGERPKEGKRPVTPGPGQYHIDRSPPNKAAAFHIKQREFKYDNLPGPGKYDTSTRIGAETPKYSMRSRIDTSKEVIRAPYQKVPDHFGNEGPKWTMSIRPKTRDYVGAPGPNYMPPPFGSDGRKWTMQSVKTRDVGHGVLSPGPGTGKYNTRPSTAGPKYSMKARQWPNDQGGADGPGAGKYCPDYNKVLPSEPKTQILEKFKEKQPETTPGYVDLGTTNKGPKWTIGRKEPLAVSPGCVA